MQLGRQEVDEVDIRIEEAVANELLDDTQDLGQLARKQPAQKGTEQGTATPLTMP